MTPPVGLFRRAANFAFALSAGFALAEPEEEIESISKSTTRRMVVPGRASKRRTARKARS